MTYRTNQTLTPEAHDLKGRPQELLSRVLGHLEALIETADIREDRRVYIGESTKALHHAIEAFMWMDKPAGVAPIAPSVLAKIMGQEEAN